MLLVQPTLEQQVFIRHALNESTDSRDKIEILKKWLEEQPHLPNTWDDHCLLMFLKGCRFSLETCKKKLEMYFIFRATLPEFFANRDIRSPKLQDIVEIVDAAVLPGLTPDGKRISISKAAKYDFETPNVADLIKIIFMVGDLRLIFEETGVLCDVYIVDVGFPLAKHFLKVNPLVFKKMFMCIQEAYPVIIKEIHVINAPPFVEFAINVIKPFLTPALRDTIHVHITVESLYDFVPKDILPEEYGGNAGKLRDLMNRWIKTMEEYSSWFKKEENIKADMSKIKEAKKALSRDYVELEGSFRKLCVD